MSTNMRHQAALVNAPHKDPDEFWVTDRVQPGRGYSSMTYAHTMRFNCVPVYMHHYTPGPFDLLAYGPESPLAAPHSRYFVYTEVWKLEDGTSDSECYQKLLAAQPDMDQEALSFGKFDIYSPDGEGALYLDFGEEIDAAFAFADSLKNRESSEMTDQEI